MRSIFYFLYSRCLAAVLISTFYFLLSVATAQAASLYFSPSSGFYAVGFTMTVHVYVSSADQAMNAASGVVSFSPGTIEIVSVSKANSIMNLWVQEPTFSNANGTLDFEGIALNPGFTGSQGTILSITFRAKSIGQARVSFLSGTILANDGIGTNILVGMGSANFSVTGMVQTKEIPTPPASTRAGNAPVIISSSHPDQSKWYANNEPEFSWKLPSDAIEVRTLIGKSSNGVPTVKYIPPISSKKVDALADGTYYFVLQIRINDGWSDVARYRVNIDTTAPNPFSITFPHGRSGRNPQPIIFFNTTDHGSGVGGYEIKVGSGDTSRIVAPTESNPYTLPAQPPGTHTATVTAIDEAGNKRSASEDFTIEAIDVPIIIYYQNEIEVGDIMKIRGTTYPDSDITVLVKNEDGAIYEEYTRSNSSGDWAIVATKHFSPGVYNFTAMVTDGRGARSAETAPLTIVVNSRFLNNLIQLVLNYFSAVILTLIILAGVVGGSTYLYYRLLGIIRRLRRESGEAEKVLEKSFKLLRKNIDRHVARLRAARSKRSLTTDELLFLEEFEKNLMDTKRTIMKEIKDVSRDIRKQ